MGIDSSRSASLLLDDRGDVVDWDCSDEDVVVFSLTAVVLLVLLVDVVSVAMILRGGSIGRLGGVIVVLLLLLVVVLFCVPGVKVLGRGRGGSDSLRTNGECCSRPSDAIEGGVDVDDTVSALLRNTSTEGSIVDREEGEVLLLLLLLLVVVVVVVGVIRFISEAFFLRALY